VTVYHLQAPCAEISVKPSIGAPLPEDVLNPMPKTSAGSPGSSEYIEKAPSLVLSNSALPVNKF